VFVHFMYQFVVSLCCKNKI